jgi:hypothetical protein
MSTEDPRSLASASRDIRAKSALTQFPRTTRLADSYGPSRGDHSISHRQRRLLVLLSLKRAQPNDILDCRLYAPTDYLPQLAFTIGIDATKGLRNIN